MPLLLPIVGSTLAIPAWYLTTHTAASAPNGFEVAMFWLAVEYLVAECWFVPTIAVLQSSVRASRTGTAQGLFVLTGALENLAPTALGWVYRNQAAAGSTGAESTGALADLLGWGGVPAERRDLRRERPHRWGSRGDGRQTELGHGKRARNVKHGYKAPISVYLEAKVTPCVSKFNHGIIWWRQLANRIE